MIRGHRRLLSIDMDPKVRALPRTLIYQHTRPISFFYSLTRADPITSTPTSKPERRRLYTSSGTDAAPAIMVGLATVQLHHCLFAVLFYLKTRRAGPFCKRIRTRTTIRATPRLSRVPRQVCPRSTANGEWVLDHLPVRPISTPSSHCNQKSVVPSQQEDVSISLVSRTMTVRV
jgi:hypothetical protein